VRRAAAGERTAQLPGCAASAGLAARRELGALGFTGTLLVWTLSGAGGGGDARLIPSCPAQLGRTA